MFRCRQACERASVCQCACARVCSIILHHSPGSPPEASLPAPSQSPQHVNAPLSCMRLAALSISVCLTRETATLGDPVPGPLTPARCAVLLPHWGTLYPVPSPLPTVLCYPHGGFSLAPSTIYCFPRGLRAKALVGSQVGSPRPAWLHTHPIHPIGPVSV